MIFHSTTLFEILILIVRFRIQGKIAASTELKFGSLVDASSIQVVSG
jgi:hypothetical protein